MEKYNIECYHNIDRFLNELKDFDVSQNPYLSYAYLNIYLKYYPKGNFYFFSVYENEEKIAIIPFECTFESTLLGIKKFRFIGYRQFNYEQYICNDIDMKKVHIIFMNYLRSQSYSIVLNIYDVNNKSPLYSPLHNDLTKKTELSLYTCPYLKFTDDFDAFFKTVYKSSKKRSELKKFQRKLNELGNIKIVNIDDKISYENNKKYIDQIYKVHAERFRGVYATSFFGEEKMRPFYSDLIESMMIYEKGFLSLLLLDDVVIAFILCVTNGKVLIDWIPAFDPAFVKYSLGIVQYKMLFEKICEQGKYKIFDYSKGSSVYKRKWAKEETYNSQFLINLSDMNPFAFMFYYIDKLKFSTKVYLRNKGILELVKKTLGLFISTFKKKKEERVKIINSLETNNKPYVFNYAEIREYPIETREAVLSAIYQGERVIKVDSDKIVFDKK